MRLIIIFYYNYVIIRRRCLFVNDVDGVVVSTVSREGRDGVLFFGRRSRVTPIRSDGVLT